MSIPQLSTHEYRYHQGHAPRSVLRTFRILVARSLRNMIVTSCRVRVLDKKNIGSTWFAGSVSEDALLLLCGVQYYSE